MSMTMLLASLALANGAPDAIDVLGARDRIDVGYRELAEGHPAEAIARIRSNQMLETDDPAALINLGTAHARLGDARAANGYYRNALISSSRYDLQLADGSWMDSRQAARLAIRRLGENRILALR